uniref:Tektin n=1 Tax=Cyprinus carpio carpio TaxID=630221 RepID=A0A8C1E680_CYPCA
KFEEMVQEIETLIIFKSRVERALESCSEPLQVTLQCLTERQKRVAIDLVHDEVEEELLKEKEVIEGVMVLLQRTLEQINEQIRLIRSVKYYLEKDLQDKFQAERIDDFCALLTNASTNLNRGNSDFSSAGTAVTPEEWESLCILNIRKAEKEKNNSLSLRALVDSLLEQTASDMRRQYEATGRAFELRIEETKTAKTQLENQLNELLGETANQEKNLESLRLAIAEKEAPLKVAQTRLSSRSQRPNVYINPFSLLKRQKLTHGQAPLASRKYADLMPVIKCIPSSLLIRIAPYVYSLYYIGHPSLSLSFIVFN